MKPLVAAALVALAFTSCSEESPRPATPAPATDGSPPREGDAGRAGRPATGDGGAGAATPAGAVSYAGTVRGETEVPDGGMPDGGTTWHGQGTVRIEVRGEEVVGTVQAEGMTLELRGNLAEGALRAWLRAPAGQPRTEGILLGALQGERITGTWRTSGPAGAEVRSGTFEANRGGPT